MQYLVEGADRTSGTDRTVIFDAANERDAQRQAEEMNLLVSRMSPHASGIPNDRAAIDYATPGAGRGAALINPGGPPRYLGLRSKSPSVAASASPSATLRVDLVGAVRSVIAPQRVYSNPLRRSSLRPAPAKSTQTLHLKVICSRIASFVLGVSCVISYGFAVILAIAAIHSFVGASAPQAPFAPPPGLLAADGSMQLFLAFVMFAGAALQHGLSAGCIAVRDIARNSFRP